MAATTPKKRAPAKAPASKFDAARQARIEKFESFRERAAAVDLGGTKAASIAPFILGPDDGFDPPIEFRYPSTLTEQLLVDEALRAEDGIGVLRIMLGRPQFYAMVRQIEGLPDAERILIGIAMRVHDHFLGSGASESGGTPAS